MILADVNVLIAAFRYDSKFHHICKTWLDGVIESSAAFGVSPLALAAVARITTGKPFTPPSSHGDAFGFCNDLLSQPHAVVIEPGARHWSIFERLCVETNIRGPTITDVWYAALAIEHGCTWITLDRDYARFPGLNWQEPD